MLDNNYNQEVEFYILRAFIMYNHEYFNYEITADNFGLLASQKLFQYIESNLKNGLPVTVVGVKSFLKEEKGKVNDNIFNELLNCDTPNLNLHNAVKLLRDLSDKRYIRGLVLQENKNLSDGSKNAQEIKESLVGGLEEVKDFRFEDKTVSIKDSLVATFQEREVETIYTGFKQLDKITTGFEEGSFVVLAAGTGMGKSALATTIAVNVAKQNKNVALFSLEMNHEQITRRIVANLASINLTKLKYNNLTSQNEHEAFTKAVKEIAELPIKINDDGFLTLKKLRSEVKRLVKKDKTKLVIIDYIQLVKHNSKNGNVERVTEITNTLKAIAMEFKIVIIGLSQLSRAVHARENKTPMLSDLRDSGSIEQDANAVLFVFRPEYYMNMEKPQDDNSAKYREWRDTMQRLNGLAYVTVAKNRDGGLGEVTFNFDKEFTRFVEL